MPYTGHRFRCGACRFSEWRLRPLLFSKGPKACSSAPMLASKLRIHLKILILLFLICLLPFQKRFGRHSSPRGSELWFLLWGLRVHKGRSEQHLGLRCNRSSPRIGLRFFFTASCWLCCLFFLPFARARAALEDLPPRPRFGPAAVGAMVLRARPARRWRRRGCGCSVSSNGLVASFYSCY